MTVSNNDGKMNVFAKEPRMYVSLEDAEQYALQNHNEKAELWNSRAAMFGLTIGLVSKLTTGSFFFFGFFN
jgi:hypothetical protein